MAVARPIRMLGAACILLCLFLIFQVNQSHGPSFISKGSKDYNGMKKDPLLDRESHLRFPGSLLL
jgi:mannosyltransferase